MDAPRWLTRSHADVPAGDALARPARAPRARRAADRTSAATPGASGAGRPRPRAGAVLALPPERIEVLAAPRRGARGRGSRASGRPLSLSLSHRAGRALAAVAAAPAVVGCDLEVVEPRSGAFVREWLAAGGAGARGRARRRRPRPGRQHALDGEGGGRRRFVARACGSTYATPWSTPRRPAPDWRALRVRLGRPTRPPAGGGRSRAG